MTESKNHDNQLRAIADFAAVLADEFNDVLMGIQAHVEVIQRQAGSQPAVARALEEIVAAVANGREVSQLILQYTQVKSPAKVPIDLVTLVRRLLPELKALAGQGAQLITRLPSAAFVVDVDENLFRQVMKNIIRNAADSIPEGGEITISIQEASTSAGKSPRCELTVQDSGAGIPDRDLPHVLEPLFTTKPGHFGLGLAVAHQIILHHEGELRFQRAPSGGMIVHIVLPMRGTRTVGEPSESATEVQIRRVVLVEDDAVVAAGIAAVLELEDIHVAIAERGADAVPLIEVEKPDVVILDIALPDMSGVDVYREIAPRWPRLPVLFSSGHADESELTTFLAEPHIGFLPKPYDLETLLTTLKRLIASR
jgi:two-component system cell cycle sensor histidine kinase/response regulator CckA